MSDVMRLQLQSWRELLTIGADNKGGSNAPSAIQLGIQWVAGTGNKVDFFFAGDEFTEQLRNDHSMDTVRDEIREKVLKGDPKRYNGGYSLVRHEGWSRLVDDATDLLTYGFTGFEKVARTGGKYGTSSATFVGSYEYYFDVLSRDAKTGKTRLRIRIENKTTINSLLHPPGKFRPFVEKWVGMPWTGIADKIDGPFRTKVQEAIWEEEMIVR
ncbi:hypothetical protein ACH4FX_43000 [Streptomyces sp. NPDC018019]|uniref:hypothetical protein n=1 Tax=Streptomyces sp. NPDC018019 TaxID=3365030 RepID=UPI0037983B80